MKPPRRLPRLVAAEAVVLLALTRMALAALPFTVVRRGLESYARVFARRGEGRGDDVELVRRAMDAVGRRSPDSSCLPEALAGWALLRRRRLPATLHLGVRRPGRARAIDAHAWVESSGRVIVGAVEDLSDYRPLVSGKDRLTKGLASLLRGDTVPWPQLGTAPEAFVAHCGDEDLTALVHQALCAHDSGWPAEVTSELAAAARAKVSAEMVRARETARVLDALAVAGVRPLIYKGTALAYGVYDYPALRPRNDTDLLVREADRPAANEALQAIGYQTTNLSGGDVLFRQYEFQREDEFGLTHALDVHWALSTQALFADLLSYDQLDAAAVPLPALGPNARALGPVDALLLACVHPAMHHQNDERLIWLYDVHLLAERMTAADWDRFADAATRKAVTAICANALERAAARLGTQAPAGVLHRLTTAAAVAGGEPTARYLDPGRRWANELAASLGALAWRDRLRLVREVAFPAPRYMLAAYGVSGARLGPVLLPLLYAHRGARGVWKVLTGRK